MSAVMNRADRLKMIARELAGHDQARQAGAEAYVPQEGTWWFCPACRIEKQENETLEDVPGDGMKCVACGKVFEV